MPKKNQNARRKPRPNGNKRRVIAIEDADDGALDYDSDNPLDGIPELAVAPPTTLIVVHGTFTAQHVIGELRYQFEMGNLTRGDRMMLAQLGKEIAEELNKER